MKGILLQRLIVHRRRSTSGRCWAVADRLLAADVVQELQVFVILAEEKGDSLRVTPLADEKKARSFTLPS